jgi:hypothetical protein
MDAILHGPVLRIDGRTKLIKGLHGLRRRLIFVHDDDFYEIGFNAERRLSEVPPSFFYLTFKSATQTFSALQHRAIPIQHASENTNNTCAHQNMIHFSDVAMAYSPRRSGVSTPNFAYMTANFADEP